MGPFFFTRSLGRTCPGMNFTQHYHGKHQGLLSLWGFAPISMATSTSPSPSPTAAALAARLEELRSRQLAVLDQLQQRTVLDAEAARLAEAAYAQLGPKAEKLRILQAQMHRLADRTADMKARASKLKGLLDDEQIVGT